MKTGRPAKYPRTPFGERLNAAKAEHKPIPAPRYRPAIYQLAMA